MLPGPSATSVAEGKTVLVHCVEGRSRTPSVAARYSLLVGENPDYVRRSMPWAEPKPELWTAATRRMDNHHG